MSRNTGILYKMKGILPQSALLTLFHSFIQSHLNYCSLVWGLGSKNSLKKLFVCQKKAIRALIPGFVIYYYKEETDEPPAHTKETFAKLNIPTVYSLILKNLLIFMHKIHHAPQLIPNAILAFFTQISEDDTDITREMSERLTTQKNSLFLKGPRLHNELISETIEADRPFNTNTLNSFKNSVNTYLIDMQTKGSSAEWMPENVRLCIQKGTRKSPRTNSTDINVNI